MPDHLSCYCVKNRHREQRKPNYKQTGDRSAIECHTQRRCAGVTCSLRRADIRQYGDAHPDVTGCEGTKRADDKTNCRWMIFKKEKQKEDDGGDDADRDDLPFQISLSSFLYRGRDFPHPFVSR